MRKLFLALISCAALVAFMSLSATAFANHKETSDPACLQEYGNQFGIYDFNVATPDSEWEHVNSGVTGNGIACGTVIDGIHEGDVPWEDWPGAESQFVRADIENPHGVAVEPTAGMEQGAYVGNGVVGVLTWLGPNIPLSLAAAPFNMTVDNSEGTDCPADAIACYRGDVEHPILQGHSWVWVTRWESGSCNNPINPYACWPRTKLTIGEFYNDLTFTPSGLTNIQEFNLCARAGAVGSTDCGEGIGAPAVQFNGDASVYPADWGWRIFDDFHKDRGIYKVTAATRDGRTTNQLRAPGVVWYVDHCAPKWLGTPPDCAPPGGLSGGPGKGGSPKGGSSPGKKGG